MTIQEFIDTADYTYINGIQFLLCYVNQDEDLGIDEFTPAGIGEVNSSELLTFTERLNMAQDELEEDTRGMSASEAFDYYQSLTEPGNAYYWGVMVYVYTAESLEDTGNTILFGVRMD